MKESTRKKNPAMESLGMWDWGSHENHPESLMAHLWGSRAFSFQAKGLDLPMAVIEPGFWDRFEFTDDCKLFVANSHVCICQDEVVERWPDFVVNYDAHHDCGYGRPSPFKTNRYSCEDWVYLYAKMGSLIDIVYPDWKDDAFRAEKSPRLMRTKYKSNIVRQFASQFHAEKPVVGPVDTVFVCLSGAWVPPWCDGQFWDFVKSCPVSDGYEVLSKAGPPLERSFDLKQAVAWFNSLTSQMAKLMVVREKTA